MDKETSRQPDTPDRVEVYTDGGCKPNPGPGGWGAVIRLDDREWSLSGNDPQTTNNQMELQAAVAALGLLDGLFGRCQVDLYTDSEYLRQGITGWIESWVQNGWQTKEGEPVKNQALWQALRGLTDRQEVNWHWLKGHAENPHNERADHLATQARQALALRLLKPPPTKPTEVSMVVKASYSAEQHSGGWAVVLRKGEHVRTLSQHEHGLSANALLVRGAAEGLGALTRPCSVTVYSDADYLIRGASQWIKGWLARGWQTRDGKPVANRTEWETLLAAMEPHRVRWQLEQVETLPDLAWAAELAASAGRPQPEEAEAA